ncbi:unnamed protein product [Pleuronectes platessa]|uniref:Protein kinase domain-containing protein n=1 Tax=Pleuronectes platessa TaxID=8262 RepID=A0A9N7VI84_PLEPL|nr:unnamed protein product [Pleuronectes platessa]
MSIERKDNHTISITRAGGTKKWCRALSEIGVTEPKLREAGRGNRECDSAGSPQNSQSNYPRMRAGEVRGSMAPPKKNVLPKPLPEGFILTDTEKRKWRLGKIIGQGGFGLIYLASRDVDRPAAADTDFVIKLEYQENGPLFLELKFYQRAAKAESMEKWMRSRKLDFLGIPTYWGSGLAEHNNLRYRFMAMDRLGTDLQKVCDRNAGRLKKATVLQLGRGLVDVLEYIHENEYVHADIKAANLMQSFRDPHKIYLADYGLSCRYSPEGVHKEYKENPKKGHNGTIEYTSLDAHKGTGHSSLLAMRRVIIQAESSAFKE